jgi:hypothetical protein
MKFNKSLYAFSSSIQESVANLFTIICSVFIFSLRVFFIRTRGVQSFLLANFHIVVTKIIGIFFKCESDQICYIWKFWKFLPIFRNHKIDKENFGVDFFVHNWSTLASILP